jgi:hypothetical protein
MAGEPSDIRSAASIPGRPTILDHVLLVAMSCGIDQELQALTGWIYAAHRACQPERPKGHTFERSVQRRSQH